MNRKDNDALGAYVRDVEEKTENVDVPQRREATVTPVYDEAPLVEEPKKPRTIEEQMAARRAANIEGAGVHYRENLGYLEIPIDSLPTGGLFYPEGFRVKIRAARGEEIKHWSTMSENDMSQLSRNDDILNYMIERCALVENPEYAGNCWRDLKSVDRIYILLAIKEFTFDKGENELMVPGEGGEQLAVHKEMIDFIQISDDLKKFYNNDKRCFTFNVAGQEINMYIPSIGVNEWLKKYAINKQNSRESYDEDFIQFAPMLIRDYRGLTNRAYEEFAASTRLWGVKEWSVISHVIELLTDTTQPKIKYQDERGGEHEIPLTFPGGLRSLFVIPDPLRALCGA